jgi:hypothetical protein
MAPLVIWMGSTAQMIDVHRECVMPGLPGIVQGQVISVMLEYVMMV